MPDPHPSQNISSFRDSSFLMSLSRLIFKPSVQDIDLEDVISQYNGSSVLPHLRKILKNILGLKDLVVSDIMRPRADIVAIEASATLHEVLERFKTSEHSRLPVYRETLDDPIGFIHLKDLMDVLLKTPEQQETFRASHILRDVMFIPASVPVLELMVDMQAKRVNLGLVVDEYGGTDGLVSIEDVVEQIVGRIDDARDEDDQPHIIVRSNGMIDVDGRTELTELQPYIADVLDVSDYTETVDTINGLVTAHAGRVPGRGEVITFSPKLEFQILEADPRRIRRLRLVKTTTLLADSASLFAE